MSEPERIEIQANFMSFAALTWGEADNVKLPLALLVHGYPDTPWTWRHLGPHLVERGWRVVAPFTRGYAPSDLGHDDSYKAADLADDLLAIHDTVGGDERAVLIGHDWGAVAAYAVTATEPERFAKYVALAVPPPPTLLRPAQSRATLGLALGQLRSGWYMVFNQLPGSGRAQPKLIPRLWKAWSPNYDGTQDAAHAIAALAAPEHRRAALRYYRNNFQGGAREAFTMKLGAPVLYLHGEDDGCMSVDLVERYPEDLPAGSRFERVSGVGHFLQLEDPSRVHALIDGWIS